MTTNGEKTDAAIIVRDLHRSFGQHEVLRGVNLDCPRGEITTIVGPSGCGKTVLLKHLNLLLRPDSGQIIIDGIDVTKLGWRELDKVREKFGMLFQGGALFDSRTGAAYSAELRTHCRDGESRRSASVQVFGSSRLYE
jgi:phospholipid/cholesterol/gamma-HCH transport system ATP-binding protein